METNIQVIEQKALSVPEQAKIILIIDNSTYCRATDLLLNIKEIRKEIDRTFDPIIAKAYAAHKEACTQKRKIEVPLEEAERIIKPRIAGYLEEQENIRRAEEEKLRVEALRKEEEERLSAAIRAEEMGESEVAEEILNEPVFVPPVELPKTTPKVSGISQSQIWRFRVIDEAKIPRNFLIPDEVKIGQYVRAMKDKTRIEGIEVYPENVIRAGRGGVN